MSGQNETLLKLSQTRTLGLHPLLPLIRRPSSLARFYRRALASGADERNAAARAAQSV
jgi:hypothetical protein